MAEPVNFVDMAFEQRRAAPEPSRESITAEEFASRAQELGMHPDEDAAYNWIVYKSFTDPLPDGWEVEYDEEGNKFFYNIDTEDSEWHHPALEQYRQLFHTVKADQPPPLPPTTHSHKPFSDVETHIDYGASGEFRIENALLKSMIHKCQAAMLHTSKHIIQHLAQRGRSIAGVEDSDSLTEKADVNTAVQKAEQAMQHLKRVVKMHILADEEVAVNVSTLRERIDEVESELEDSQDMVSKLQSELEANNEKWSIKLERRKKRVHDLTNELNDLFLRNEDLSAECQRYKQLEDKDRTHSPSSVQEEKTQWQLKAAQEKYTALELSVTSLKEELSASVQQCRDAEKKTAQVELLLKTAEIQAEAALQAVQEELTRGQQLQAEQSSKVAQLESQLVTVNAELQAERGRAQGLESGLGLTSSDYTMLNNKLKDEVQNERAALQAELGVERDRFLALAKVESALRAQHDTLVSKLTQSESDMSELRENLSCNEAKRAALSTELSVAQGNIHIYGQKISELQTDLLEARNTVIESSNNEAVLTARLTTQSEKATLQMKSLDMQVLNLREELQSALNKCQQLEKCEAEMERAKMSEREAQAALENLRMSTGVAEEAVVGLRGTVATLESDLASERQQHAALLLRLEELNNLVEKSQANQLETTKAEAAIATELKVKLDIEVENVAMLQGSVAALTASLEEKSQCCHELEKEKARVEYMLEVERTQATDCASRNCENEQKLVAMALELSNERNKNKELSAGLGQQSSDSISLCDRLKQEVQEKEAELKQERERLLVLSRTESELNARLEGEAERTKSLVCNLSDLKEQLTKCHDIESSKVQLEAQLHAEEERFHLSLKTAKEELLQERAKYSTLLDVESQLQVTREELLVERRKGYELDAILTERTKESAALVERLKQEVSDRDSELKQEREALLELSTAKAELVGRLQGETEKCEIISNHVLELERKIDVLTTNLEIEQKKCAEMQNGMGQQSNDSAALCNLLRQEVQEKETQLQQDRETMLSNIKTETTLRTQLENNISKIEQLDATILELTDNLRKIQKEYEELQDTLSEMKSAQKVSAVHTNTIEKSLAAVQLLLRQEEEKRAVGDNKAEALTLHIKETNRKQQEQEAEMERAKMSEREAQAALENLRMSTGVAEEAVVELRGTVATLESDLASERQQHAALLLRLEEVQSNLSTEKQTHLDLMHVNGCLTAKLDQAKEEQDRLQNKVSSLETQLLGSKENILEATVALEKSRSQLETHAKRTEELQNELVSERERLLDLSRREASHAATLSSGLSDKSKLLEASLEELERKLFNSETRCRELELESKKHISKLEGDLVKAQNTAELSRKHADSEIAKGSELNKVVIELEKHLVAARADLEHEKQHSKDLLQKSNNMLVEISSERNRYLDLSKSNAATVTLCEVETEKNATLTKTIREIRLQLASMETAFKELEAEKLTQETALEAEQAAAKHTIDVMQTTLTNEQQKNASLATTVADLERNVHSLTGELEVEQSRCLELQSGLGQKNNDFALLCDRLKLEVHEKEAELKQERERLLVLSRTESELNARLEGEAERTKSLVCNLSDLKEQLREKTAACQECETEKSRMESLLQTEAEQHKAVLQTAQADCTRTREEFIHLTHECAELKTRLGVQSEQISAATALQSESVQRLELLVSKEQNRADILVQDMHTTATELVKTRAELDMTSALVTTLTAETKELSLAALASENRSCAMEVELKHGQQEKEKKCKEVESLREEISVLEDKARSADDLQSQLTRTTSELTYVKAELQEHVIVQRDTLIELHDTKAKLSEKELELTLHSQRVSESQSIQDILQSNFAALTNSILSLQHSQAVAKESEEASKLTADIRILDMKIHNLNNKLSEENQRSTQAENALATANTDLASFKSQIIHLEAELKSNSESKQVLVQDLTTKLKDLEQQLQRTQTDFQMCQMEKKQISENVQNSLSSEKKQVEILENKLSEYKKSKSRLSIDLDRAQENSARLQIELTEARGSSQSMENSNSLLTSQVKTLSDRVKKLNEIIVELKGSIRVFCRVRPVEFTTDCRREDVEELVRYPDYNLIDFKKSMFEFDQVFDAASSQEAVYEEVEPFVRSAMGGLRVCIFAYGQTSSGKTHTMEGPPGNRGVNLRALETVMELSASAMEDFTTVVRVSMLEVYNEKIKDLLDLTGDDLEVRMGKQGTHVHSLSEWRVQTVDEALELFARGQSNRQVASNNVNEHSSRSHLVILVKISRTSTRRGGEGVEGYLYLVDLAGSERIKQTAATGQRLKEAQNINKSLSSLGDVISALASNQKHVPYRNSKLTYLLQDALRDNSKVLMFVNINPTPVYANESVCSLTFASRCRSVALGQATKKITHQDQKAGSSQR